MAQTAQADFTSTDTVESEPLLFRGRRDWLWYGVLTLFVLGTIFILFTLFRASGEAMLSYFALILLALCGAFLAPLQFCYYALLTAESLVVQFGVFKRSWPVSELRSVRPCQNFISSLALAHKRLEIKTCRGERFYLSLYEEEVFIRRLEAQMEEA